MQTPQRSSSSPAQSRELPHPNGKAAKLCGWEAFALPRGSTACQGLLSMQHQHRHPGAAPQRGEEGKGGYSGRKRAIHPPESQCTGIHHLILTPHIKAVFCGARLTEAGLGCHGKGQNNSVPAGPDHGTGRHHVFAATPPSSCSNEPCLLHVRAPPDKNGP